MSWFNDFHLGENLTYRSGGIRRAMSLSEQEIDARQKRIIAILEKYSQIHFVDMPEWPAVDISHVRESNVRRVMRLLEENSALIDASHYLSSDIAKEWKSIADITETLCIFRVQIMTGDSRDKIGIYDFVDVTIWEIIFDLVHDIKKWLWSPSEEEKKNIEDLYNERKRFLDFVNNPKSVMVW